MLGFYKLRLRTNRTGEVINVFDHDYGHDNVLSTVAVLRGGLDGPFPPSFFLISPLSSFGWHI